MDLGGQTGLRNATWTVAGLFEADGSAYESEVWADPSSVQPAFRTGGFLSSMPGNPGLAYVVFITAALRRA